MPVVEHNSRFITLFIFREGYHPELIVYSVYRYS